MFSLGVNLFTATTILFSAWYKIKTSDHIPGIIEVTVMLALLVEIDDYLYGHYELSKNRKFPTEDIFIDTTGKLSTAGKNIILRGTSCTSILQHVMFMTYFIIFILYILTYYFCLGFY